MLAVGLAAVSLAWLWAVPAPAGHGGRAPPAGIPPSGMTPGQLPSARRSTVVTLTFDDGDADQMTAARVLRRRGLAATFYIITGAVGTPGYVTRSDTWTQACHRRGRQSKSAARAHRVATSGADRADVHPAAKPGVRSASTPLDPGPVGHQATLGFAYGPGGGPGDRWPARAGAARGAGRAARDRQLLAGVGRRLGGGERLAGDHVRGPAVTPRCWMEGGYGHNTARWQRTTDSYAGRWAQRLTITSYHSGDAKLLPQSDLGKCSLPVQAGQPVLPGQPGLDSR